MEAIDTPSVKNRSVETQQNAKPEETKESGAAALRRAVDTALLKGATEVGDALVESSKKGHILSTKFAYELSQAKEQESKSEAEDKLRTNLAEEWEADRKWLADMKVNAAKLKVAFPKPD